MNRPADHSLVAAWVQSGNHRVRCSCGAVGIASTRAFAAAQLACQATAVPWTEVPLGRGHCALVDVADLELIQDRPWRVSREGRKWLYAVSTGTPLLRMHRVILGVTDPKVYVDHRNGDGLDNRRANLRTCSNTQNQQNRHVVAGGSRYKGVTWHRKCQKWQAAIKVNGQSIYLGLFESEIEAAHAYDQAAEAHFGDFACGNFGGGAA